MKNISILGVTGSIGTQALDVLRFHKDKFKLVAISAYKNIDLTLDIIEEFKPRVVAINDKASFEKLKNIKGTLDYDFELLYGMEGLIKVATLKEVHTVLTSVVGMIGLKPTLEAIKCKKDIALANKETLVVAGELVMNEAKKYGVKILPVDSEHSAIFQCFQGNDLKSVDKIIITASGGPFRGYSKKQLENVSLNQALNHPKWSMGKKITIDSSTLMNKGLEVIEAHWLFDCDYENIEVVVHPQSIIHSMVQYKDGAVIAQLGVTDMKLPIQYALNYPLRDNNISEKLDFYKINELNFYKPDTEVFRCLKLAYKAGKMGGLMPTILNGANEVCVDLFLNEKIKYLDIPTIVEECMEVFKNNMEVSLKNIIDLDKSVREYIMNKYN
ncbi:1-deoxy-D-xylulose-5-phosphate reductoisomerase [Sarcina sp. JB2]|uniref:1-deoxy-D-xylulose-5-phosphate reductoisomerase n=1 Tax=Candidatus Sarcina troglodytae TaxID=2726954 RepID=A0ACD1BE79_9CLOT|nr:1-deoxy-D-xylulose-5-phosphate reductoisomerase [Sarcina sp. JB2]QPJ85637.1 1-deoxy-D-xylulose-5-phosphate reductoisomerase [Sarcina sp. JB2]